MITLFVVLMLPKQCLLRLCLHQKSPSQKRQAYVLRWMYLLVFQILLISVHWRCRLIIYSRPIRRKSRMRKLKSLIRTNMKALHNKTLLWVGVLCALVCQSVCKLWHNVWRISRLLLQSIQQSWYLLIIIFSLTKCLLSSRVFVLLWLRNCVMGRLK